VRWSGLGNAQRRHALCELVHPHDRSIRPVVSEIRDWIIEQMRSDMAAIAGSTRVCG